MHLIDLHYHTRESDGKDTVERSIEVAQEKCMAALCITNHLSGSFRHSYNKTVENILKLNTNYPVHIGMELGLLGEEMLVFGKSLCDVIAGTYEQIRSWQQVFELRDSLAGFLILPHPAIERTDENLLTCVDGIEISMAHMIIGKYLPLILDKARQNGLRIFANTDSHYADNESQHVIGRLCNIMANPVPTEKEFFEELKRGPVGYRLDRAFYQLSDYHLEQFEPKQQP